MADSQSTTSGIYAIRFIHGNKVYIGQTINFGTRWDEHRNRLKSQRHPNRHLQSAWLKHGEDAFSFEVLKYIAVPPDLSRNEAMNFLVADEQCCIDEYKSLGFKLYNVRPSASSNLGIKFSDEVRANMSASRKGRTPGNKGKKHSDEARAKMSAAQKNRPPASEETRRKISIAHKGRKQPPEAVAKVAAAHRGKPLSDEHRAKMSAAFKGRVMTPEHRAKIAKANTGRIVSEEVRAKFIGRRHSEETLAKMRGRTFSPEHRARIAAARRGTTASPEARAKQSAARRGKKRSPESIAKSVEARRGQIRKPITEETRAKMSIAHREAWRRRKQAKGRGQLTQGRLFD